MPWGVVAAVAGAAISADSARSTSNKQKDATKYAADLQWDQYEQTREDQAPYREAGYSALDKLSVLLGLSDDPNAEGYGSLMQQFTGADLASDPGYKFRMEQGQAALENSAAARGSLFSGSTGKALTEYGQGFASNEFQNAWNRDRVERGDTFNRLSGVAGTGQTAVNQVNAAGQNAVNVAGQMAIGGANAQAAGQMAGANAWGDAFNHAGAAYMRQRPNYFNPYTQPGADGAYANPYGDTGGGVDPYGYLGGASSAGDYSDEALKEDIERIGTRPDGLGVYVFRYLWDIKRRVGLMAQEVESLYPQAVRRDAVGFLKVDYSMVP